MSGINLDLNIINQKGTPAFYSDIFANRPAFGYAGRVFISTDTGAIYEDTGTAWTLIADAGAGTTGTLQQVTTNGNTTTLGIVVDGININNGAGTGTENTAIGKSSLNNNTTGYNNTALGSYSLGFNTTGNNNTAIGVNSLINNTTGTGHTAIGSGALQSNTTGNNSTSIGYSSLNSNTTGAGNTAVGTSSLQSNTTGGNNTSIGSETLPFNTTGSNNTALGQQSLFKNTTGFSNNAIGISSLFENTTGSNNTGVGIFSLTKNTTGTQNTAIGNYSLQNNTTASDNTAIGYNSLNLNTTGTQNTAIGSSTLTTNTTGFSNTAIGYTSLFFNTTGGGNIAIGSASLLNNTTGNDNIAIGFFAGGGTTGNTNTIIGKSAGAFMTTASSNVLIGNLSGYNITTGSNNTILGSYQGTTTLASNIILSDGAGNVRLFSNSAGLIGINQAVGTPSAQLDIHTTATYGLGVNGTGTSNAYLGFANAGTFKWRIGNTYNAGANSLDFYNVGTSATALSINSSNNIGIGTTNITGIGANYTSLNINGNTGFGAGIVLKVNNTPETYFYAETGLTTLNIAGAYSITGTFGTAFKVSSGGNVLIGTTTDTGAKLEVYGGNIKIVTTINGVNGLLSFTGAGGSSNIYNYNSILSINDQILIANSGGAVTIGNLAGTGSRAVLADANGVLSAPVSDISVKENIINIGYGLNEILKMNPVWFEYIDEYKSMGNGRQNGNIAQEMEAIIPEAVFTTPTTGKMGINYDQLHAVYIKAIQELKAEINDLKNN
jgi:hypothetical protein